MPSAEADPSISVTKSTSKSPSTPTSKSTIPTPTPTLIIPSQCQDCYGPNNTSNMVCYKNTQCVPLDYLCDNDNNPCTDDDGVPDSDDPILCQDQLCVPQDFLPVPSPGFGELRGSSRSDCLTGSYYSLFGAVPKYTLSCVEPYQDAPTECESWEYAAQSSCFLSTCGPGLDCEPPYECKKIDSSDLFGICKLNGTLNGTGNSDQSDGEIISQHSANHYLIQGLLIGLFSLTLGIGLGVGFWYYKRKHTRARWTRSDRDRSVRINALEKSNWTSKLLFCGRRGRSRSRNTINSTTDGSSIRQSGDSNMDSESIDGSFMGPGHPNSAFSGRWRWARGNERLNSVMGSSGFSIFPEMEPPPIYNNGPDLPKYDDDAEEIALTGVNTQRDEAVSRPVSSHAVEVASNVDIGMSSHVSTTSPIQQSDSAVVTTLTERIPEEAASLTTPPTDGNHLQSRIPSVILQNQSETQKAEK
ncbi:hypothetical protein BGZ80_008955 [Entomortierella chlamydospora]|uniref:Uncharacterized protein n=1 Tax=Entomortierella chlamydospora TaxID=101097 RepID=A0A9P6T0X8_9FUNG|nr:hypothetical protein BGZ79_004382 [Entomortierella chlamydospora]KAG0016754.1 hypothetical protein BGZ80_008955 [Entomortierella chlamydospora]